MSNGTATDALIVHTRQALVCAAVLLAWEGAVLGTFSVSPLICPFWFLVSLIQSIIRRPGWAVGFVRSMIPVLTLALVLGNTALQSRIAHAHAERVIQAAEEYRRTVGTYPAKLDELVPRHLSSVPRAKYSLLGVFLYIASTDRHSLAWSEQFPPFGWSFYVFEEARWGYFD